ncbi:TIGR03960 family B12-binding radical SAM protein [Clostridium cochlearium]|uniref:TIGR03960 family B12-binding radical SAM protein n=1 Tax=Clostridium cochlearium TaxID=1494 RepID=UPI001EE02ED7|nr:TIGR03960 family B12-binding radical SAM protein [Clostridium cochlearium]MBV1817198.1 TIGR03960 family B12-binding radical SAM protein [Bacteroidales bacterium MSK.15.36]MCG4571376.1 TIGR03960 family B12-binding radical SAM protein [Clostridium cochlearium]
MNFNLDDILYKVEKPGRYIGEEFNSYIKDKEKVDIRFAFCFPDVYEVGMSHLGMKILYYTMNKREDTYCERAFAPWPDMEKELRNNNIPLFTLETKDSLSKFDFVGFTLQYEMSYTNILNMLNMSNIPLTYEKRREEDPLIVCGGPCAYNPEPLYKIVDFFVLGEGEEVTNEYLDLYKEFKKQGKSKSEYLRAISKIEGIYVPSLYEASYNQDGTLKDFKPIYEDVPKKVKKRIIKDLNQVDYPDKLIVPYTEIVHDRITLETFRGCTRGCRFCQAGMIYRPVREKGKDKLIELADQLLKSTGYNEISLTSLSICDYSDVDNLIKTLIEKYMDEKVGVSLPSLRIDSFFVELINEIQKVRKTGLTFAPEAGTQKMRDVINKGVTEEDLIRTVRSAFESGWSTIKLYYMLGLPYETVEDVKGIAHTSEKVVDQYYKVPKDKRKKGLRVNVSASIFVPKPFTPFQWVAQDREEDVKEKIYALKDEFKSRAIHFTYHASKVSFLEAIFARADRRVCDVLIRAFEKGCKFDGWSEYFNYDAWMEAFEECGIDPEFYAYRNREYSELLPWDFIDIGVNKSYLIEENERAKRAEVTKDCRQGCTNCGVNKNLGGNCFEGSILNKIH